MARDFAVDVDISVQEQDVERMLMGVNTFLNPLALMGFLSGAVAPFIRQRAEQRFFSEGDDVSGPWAPLEPATQEIRQQMNVGGAGPINRRTDDLFDYITQSPDEVTPLGAFGAQLTYPSPNAPQRPYTAIKVQTAQIGKGKQSATGNKTPPRPVLGLGITDLTHVIAALGVGIRKAGGF